MDNADSETKKDLMCKQEVQCASGERGIGDVTETNDSRFPVQGFVWLRGDFFGGAQRNAPQRNQLRRVSKKQPDGMSGRPQH
jgi:hypothetical protein